MKRYFIFATAAIALLVGCNKKNLDDVQVPSENESPVAIELGVNAPSITVTKTRAAVDDWNKNKVYVYGLKHERTNGAVNEFGAMYKFTSESGNILGTDNKGYEAEATANNTGAEGNSIAPLEIYANPTTKIPYYYEDGQTYDFFGYHLGGATQGTLSASNDIVSFPVTIAGNNDVMFAYADKTNDLEKFTPKNSETATAADVYSSWAARRGVHPTLVFEHALTRFNFIVQGAGDKYETVQIQKIVAKTVVNGTLTVVGTLPVEGGDPDASTIGYTYTDVADDALTAEVTLKDANDLDITPAMVTANDAKEPFGGKGASLMVAPDRATLPIVVTMKNQVAGFDTSETEDDVWGEEYDYKFAATAAQVVKDGSLAGLSKFEAGKAYNIYINVYGPEEIKITAELTEWENGGDFTYDPDDAFRPGSSTPSTTEVTVESTAVIDGTDETAYNIFYGGTGAPQYDASNPTYPWLGVKVNPFDEDVTLYINCFNDGTPVAFRDPVDGAWYTRSADNLTAIVPFAKGKTVVSFEAQAELGFAKDADLSKVTFEVKK